VRNFFVSNFRFSRQTVSDEAFSRKENYKNTKITAEKSKYNNVDLMVKINKTKAKHL
jgi:hypothetical protein